MQVTASPPSSLPSSSQHALLHHPAERPGWRQILQGSATQPGLIARRARVRALVAHVSKVAGPPRVSWPGRHAPCYRDQQDVAVPDDEQPVAVITNHCLRYYALVLSNHPTASRGILQLPSAMVTSHCSQHAPAGDSAAALIQSPQRGRSRVPGVPIHLPLVVPRVFCRRLDAV